MKETNSQGEWDGNRRIAIYVLYHYYDELNAYGHPTEEMIAKAGDKNIGKSNNIFPVTGKSRKNIDKMFPDSEKDDKIFPDSDKG